MPRLRKGSFMAELDKELEHNELRQVWCEPLFKRLHDDVSRMEVAVQSLVDKMSSLENKLSYLDGHELPVKISKTEERLVSLERFRDRVYGALVIINVLWIAVMGYVISALKALLTH